MWKQTDLDDCAQAFVDIARNTSMTGQKIQIGMKVLFFLIFRFKFQWERSGTCIDN